MENEQIMGGSVRLLQRIKTGDYEHKEATVELTFSSPEGRDYRDVFDRAGNEVQDKVAQLLGLKKASLNAPKATKLPKATEPAAQAEPLTAKGVDPVVAEPVVQPEHSEWEAAPREITDKMLTDACGKTNERINDPNRIRAVISKYATAGMPSSSIPQAQRQSFLDDLEALK